ncbi:MAG: ATP-binding protein [Candidatus Parabeggiatoa sp.]|nr:ATP-binding protein [Candidatus Parabeggiatoa sp.]
MHYFENFKSFAKAELDLSTPFTVIIGPNGSGKSNLIEAIELLSFIADGGPLHNITDMGRENQGLQIRGSLSGCPRYGNNVFSLRFSGELMKKTFSYSVTLQTEPTPLIKQENLVYNNRTIFETINKKTERYKDDILVRYDHFAQDGKKSEVPVLSSQSVISQYPELATKNQQRDEYIQILKNIKHSLHRPFVFEPNPKQMRQYERVGPRVLAKDGANLSAVLYALAHGNLTDIQTIDRLLNWLKKFSDSPYQAFDFDMTKYNSVMFGLIESHDNYSIGANLLSDGTLRLLAILTALETVEPASLMIIEEFDNGLHPSRIEMLINAIFECCQRRNINVLVTTHNPATLNTLEMPVEQLEGLILSTWDNTEQTAKLTRFFDLPRFEAFLEKGHLGDLVTQRLYERYLVSNFEDKHHQEVLAWLENLP